MSWRATVIALQTLAEEEIGARLRASARSARAREDAAFGAARSAAESIAKQSPR